jgi:DNA mismatch endonuclease (patch repair protein)
MLSNRGIDTKPELALRKAVHALGLRYRVNFRIRDVDFLVRPDLVFTAKKVCVFVDGCFWHCCPEHASNPKSNTGYWQTKLKANVSRDRRADQALAAKGWLVMRIWEHEDMGDAAGRVAQVMQGTEG